MKKLRSQSSSKTYYIVADNAVISDSSGKPFEFDHVRKTKSFIRNHHLEVVCTHVVPVLDISRYKKRKRINESPQFYRYPGADQP